MKRCSTYYVREPCTKHIENYVCYKYKYHLYGSLDIPCSSNMNTSFIFNAVGWYSTCTISHYRGYFETRDTDEYYFNNNVTQEKLDEVFKFNDNLKSLCDWYYYIPSPCCVNSCYISVNIGDRLVDITKMCSIYDKLLERNVTYNPVYKNIKKINIPAIIPIFMITFVVTFICVLWTVGIMSRICIFC